MNELKVLSDIDLHQKMLVTSQKEREVTACMISMIEEAGRRKFFLDLGFGTLFEYLTAGLKYSAGAAMRRISAARIARELPEVKEKILDGSLSLSSLSQAEQFFRNEEKQSQRLPAVAKREVLKKLEHKSTRETERTLLALSSAPEQLKGDRVKSLTPDLTQITFHADSEFMKYLEEVRGLLAHKIPDGSLSEVMGEMIQVAAAGLRKRKFKVAEGDHSREVCVEGYPIEENAIERDRGEADSSKGDRVIAVSGAGSEVLSNLATASSKSNSRHIPAAVQREIYRRDQGRCVAVNPLTGKSCKSVWKVEFDHYPIPWAMGGASTVENLRLVCRSCNLLHAVQSFGRDRVVGKVG